ncbi:DUF4328 domain-containing protein [Kribbella sp. NPDC048915]|uniref:DUF4328 domain-containing protein n=1 Tax=Kribbella sp. NPDC048915 TaxID=3155148 RepID=UPI0033CEA32D
MLLWRSYDEVKRFVYGLLSDEEIERGFAAIAGSGPFLNLIGYLLIGTAIAFLIWLWRARDNVDVLYAPFAPQPGMHPGQRPQGAHRRSPGWVIGSWFCPIVQFWYPLQIVTDVARASEPPTRPGIARSGGVRALLATWWVSWCGFWLIIVGGGTTALVGTIVWIVRLVNLAEESGGTSSVDFYDLQDFMVRLALAFDIGFTVATVLLVIATIAVSLLILQVGQWQRERFEPPAPVRDVVPPNQPPQYVPRSQHRGPGFPTYGP